MSSKHLARSVPFYMEVLQLAQKLMGVYTKDDLRKAAKLLLENTTDSQCMINAARISTMPVFTLIAKDPCARVALQAWITEAERQGLHADNLPDARECLKEFGEFQR